MRILQFIALTFLLVGISACHKSGNLKGRYLRISIHSEVCSLDPRLGVDAPSIFPQRMLFEGLMRKDLDGTAHPAIAQRYEVTDDLKTFTFYLRPTVWSNGDKLTAYDFEYAWKTLIDPQTETLGVYNFYAIKNVKQASLGQLPIEAVGIKALDDYTLKVELENPTPYFLELVTLPSFFPINARVDRENRKWAVQEGAAFVCNGPFILEKHRIDNEICVKKNPLYWDAASVKLPGISIAILKDPVTQLNLFEAGELDWLGQPLSKISLDAIETLKNENKLHFINALGVHWYSFNTESFPFQNKKMRKAFSYAVNRELITKHVLQCNESHALGVLSKSMTGMTPQYFEDNDNKLAVQLFNEALTEMGISRAQLPEITINYAANPINQRVAETIQEQWSKLFLLKIMLERHEWKVHFEKLKSGNFQMGSFTWSSSLRDPIYTMQAFRYKSDGINMTRWENKLFQDLISATEQEVNQDKRLALFKQAEAVILEDMPVIPIFFTTITYAKNEKLKNVFVSELNEIDFRWAYFEP